MISHVTLKVTEHTAIERASLPMAVRVGEVSVFFDLEAKDGGMAQLAKLIDVLQQVKTAGPSRPIYRTSHVCEECA